MSHLPLELLLAIVESVEDNVVLLNLRLASKSFNALVAPLVFRILSVRDSVESAGGLACLQAGGAATVNAVQEIVFRAHPEAEDTDLPDKYHSPESGHSVDDDVVDKPVSGEKSRDALFAAFSGLAKFCNLRTLCFMFHRKHRELDETVDNPSHFLLLQRGLFEVLAAHPPPPLASLALHDVIAIPHNIYAIKAFQNIFRPLTALDVTIIAHGTRGYDDPQLCDFWETVIPSILENSPNLTSLTLRANCHPVGARPAIPLGLVHFPMLTELSLDNFVLDPARADNDIVEFIVRHKATLMHLKLVVCYVYTVEQGVYPRPWHAVLRRFQQELLGLRSFQALASISNWTSLLPFRYLYAYPHNMTHDLVDPYARMDHEHLDEPALKALLSALESRFSTSQARSTY
ncbi:hypothetical protein K438DRAFT_1831981 [Mycena galopus ATCC 62051]|nr:hypothetical protein K438DRAFT_1831981 [Mycena galopus ATCC 62051]